MNPEAKRRRQSLKILISEAIMVIAVAITVIILALLVSGYWLNSDLKVERQGMLQVSSTPTGADVLIDDKSSWLQRTNTSKVLPAGEHTVTLTKEGYDTWSKTITISEGLLYRLHYPRLFLKTRTKEQYYNIKDITYATVSPDHELVFLLNNTSEWSLIRLSEEKPQPRSVDVAGIFSNLSAPAEASFTSTVISTDWSQDSSHILFKIQNGDSYEWVLLDVKNPARSINLTREFGASFSEIQILDNSANNLLAAQNGKLHRIDTSAKSMSAVLVEGIISFDHFENDIVFTAGRPAATNDSANKPSNLEPSLEDDIESTIETTPYYIGLMKLGDDKATELLPLISPSKIVVSKFYDDKYLTLLNSDQVTMYRKDDMEIFAEYSLQFQPNTITVGQDGGFIVMSEGAHIATIDMESSSITDWSVSGETFDWLDSNMLYSVADGELTVYDYDGLNRRALSQNVSAQFPVTITGGKWLYYFSDGHIVREWIVEH